MNGMRRAWIHGRSRGWTRFPGAGLLVALVLLSALDLHLDGKEHGVFPPGGDGIYVPEAVHPDQPLHLEQAHPEHRPVCTACLHHLQIRGARLRAVATLVPPASCLAPAVEARWVPSGSSRCPSGARAPPSLS
jgi:hypothetical protein